MNILALIFLFLYLITATLVVKWTTLKSLGWIVETPEYFIRKPHYYNFLVLIFFVIFVILVLILKFSFSTIIFILIVRLIPPYLGELLAFKNYRKVMKEMHQDDKSTADKKDLAKEILITNKELKARLKVIKF